MNLLLPVCLKILLYELGDANAKYPVYRGVWQGTPLTFALAMVGAPSCVAMLEELHALGAKRFVVFGNCGVLNQQIRDCGIIIPTAAVRDEVTSMICSPTGRTGFKLVMGS